LERRPARPTTLVVAHRLSTVAGSDQILVLEGGRVVQSGTHAELARTAGSYQRLWTIQGAFEQDLDQTLAAAAAHGGGP